MSFVRSISVGRPQDKAWAGLGFTSIDKQPVTGPVEVHALGIDGDQVSDTKHHGGLDQAVYAFAREDLDFWEAELGLPIRDGQFGENLTTQGIDLNALPVGTRLRIGDPAVGVLLEAVAVRIPCNDFKGWMGESGFDPTAWVRRFTAQGRPGPYLRVLETGTIAPGDPIEIAHLPDHGVSVSDLFIALSTDRARLPELLAIEGLLPKFRAKVDDFVQRSAGSLPKPSGVA